MSTEVIFSFLNFFLFLFLLVWFSRKPVRAILEKKRLAVQVQLNGAMRAKKSAAELGAELQAKTQALAGDLQALRAEAAAQSRFFAEEAQKRGALLSQKITADTQEMMQAEIIRAKAQIQSELLSLVEGAVVQQIREHQGNIEQKRVFAQDMETVTRLLAEGSL